MLINEILENKEITTKKIPYGFTLDLMVDGNHVGQYTHTRDDDIVRNFAEIFPEYRNKGYGTMLLLAAIKTADNMGMDFEEDTQSLTPAMSRLYDELSDSGLIYGGGGAWTVSPSGENELEDWLLEVTENFADRAKAATDKAYSENKLLDKPTPSIKQLSKKHNVDKDDIISQVKKGVKVELEHTSDPKIALEIALDHINELPDYYDRLETVEENFADGKVKGKSRPGRVKRAGASCKGSVTDLRAKAKKSSGERAKMYHWCANMKSGKKKK